MSDDEVIERDDVEIVLKVLEAFSLTHTTIVNLMKTQNQLDCLTFPILRLIMPL